MVYIILGKGFEPMEAIAPCDILRRGGAALHSPGEGASDGDLHRDDPLREPALRRGDAHAVPGSAVDEGSRAAGKA